MNVLDPLAGGILLKPGAIPSKGELFTAGNGGLPFEVEAAAGGGGTELFTLVPGKELCL